MNTPGPTAARALALLADAGYPLVYEHSYNRTMVCFMEGQFFGTLTYGRTGRLVRVSVQRQIVRRGPVVSSETVHGAHASMAAIRAVVAATAPLIDA